MEHVAIACAVAAVLSAGSVLWQGRKQRARVRAISKEQTTSRVELEWLKRETRRHSVELGKMGAQVGWDDSRALTTHLDEATLGEYVRKTRG